jgi:protein-tyrosine phosphatase
MAGRDEARPARTSRVVDFHNHMMPGVDDGAVDAAESREGLERLRDEGVRALITTPHVDASLVLRPDLWEPRMSQMDAAWSGLRAVAAALEPVMPVWRGAEIRLDVPDPDLSDSRLRLAGGAFVLVEFPYFAVPPRSDRTLGWLCGQGWVPVIAHPERYAGVRGDDALIASWREAGAYLQVTTGSLLGRYGGEARELALHLIGRGWVDYLCSDYHARGRPQVAACRTLLDELGAGAQADLLMSVNPSRLLEGDAPLAVPPFPIRRGLWSRLSAALRR